MSSTLANKHTETIRKAVSAQLELPEKAIFFRPNNIRLSYVGCVSLKKVAKSYEFRHDNDFKSKHIMALVALKYPFYLSKKFFVVFSDEDALLITLHGDVLGFLDNSFLFRGS